MSRPSIARSPSRSRSLWRAGSLGNRGGFRYPALPMTRVFSSEAPRAMPWRRSVSASRSYPHVRAGAMTSSYRSAVRPPEGDPGILGGRVERDPLQPTGVEPDPLEPHRFPDRPLARPVHRGLSAFEAPHALLELPEVPDHIREATVGRLGAPLRHARPGRVARDDAAGGHIIL